MVVVAELPELVRAFGASVAAPVAQAPRPEPPQPEPPPK
jgi:hypothetical protein